VPVNINRRTAGVQLPKTLSADIIAAALDGSTVLSEFGTIPMPGAGLDFQTVTGEPTAAWVAETDEKPVSRHTFGTKTVTPYKMAVIEPFSNEFKRDKGALYAVLAQRLPFALSRLLDATVLGAQAAPGSGFDTLAGAPAMTVRPSPAAPTTDTTTADLLAVYAYLAGRGVTPSAWIGTAGFEAQMLGARFPDNTGIFASDYRQLPAVGRILGAPLTRHVSTALKTSTTVGDDTAIVGDFRGRAKVGIVENITIRASDQATINDGGTSLNLWQRNMFALLVEFEVGCVIDDVNNFVRVTDGIVDTP
jgi:HK97 family phage major capsid protein